MNVLSPPLHFFWGLPLRGLFRSHWKEATQSTSVHGFPLEFQIHLTRKVRTCWCKNICSILVWARYQGWINTHGFYQERRFYKRKYGGIWHRLEKPSDKDASLALEGERRLGEVNLTARAGSPWVIRRTLGCLRVLAHPWPPTTLAGSNPVIGTASGQTRWWISNFSIRAHGQSWWCIWVF